MFHNPKIEKVSINVEGSSNQLYSQGLRSFKQYEAICKYFAEGKQKGANTNEVQKHLQLHDVSFGEQLTIMLYGSTSERLTKMPYMVRVER